MVIVYPLPVILLCCDFSKNIVAYKISQEIILSRQCFSQKNIFAVANLAVYFIQYKFSLKISDS